MTHPPRGGRPKAPALYDNLTGTGGFLPRPEGCGFKGTKWPITAPDLVTHNGWFQVKHGKAEELGKWSACIVRGDALDNEPTLYGARIASASTNLWFPAEKLREMTQCLPWLRGGLAEPEAVPGAFPVEAEAMAVNGLSDEEARAVLIEAVTSQKAVRSPAEALEDKLRTQAVEMLGGAESLGWGVNNEYSLVKLIVMGFPSTTIKALRTAGIPAGVMTHVVAPHRTLQRRKANNERLSRSESDAVWRLSHCLALASYVLDSHKAALSWLARPKAAIGEHTPFELLETSVGTRYVEQLLLGLELGVTA